ncbi:sensor histidine kinase [Ochrobactrum soli]|nr:cache domain-containing protein [[Ochrobactrum] soli]
MLVILPILLGISIYRWNAKFDEITISKVSDDLTIAHQFLARLENDISDRLVSVSGSARFIELLNDAGQTSDLSAFLHDVSVRQRLDFLYLMASDGQILASAFPLSSTDLRQDWPVAQSAFRGQPLTQFEVYSEKELGKFSPALARKARVEIVRDGKVDANAPEVESRGLVLHSAGGVSLPDGKTAALVGGVLLNNNLSFVDTINSIIYSGSGLPQGSRGTVTIFLDDIRVSTNMRLFEGRRAIGTRVSDQVRHAVLDEGRTWLNSAFVVNDWYVSAYEPITDSHDNRVGMLYAGYLQKPFTEAMAETLFSIIGAFLVAVAATIPLFLIWAGKIFRPLEQMNATIARIKNGDLSARTKHSGANDEIGQVATHLDLLLDLLQHREDELRILNNELNERVEQRVQELQKTTNQLEITTRQLIMSEKLASIGEITAGVAHEINNPIAVMQGNIEVIRDIMGANAKNAATEFQLIDQQMHRVTEIVTKLLQFARPQEYSDYAAAYPVSTIIADTSPLVQHLLKKTSITLEHFDTTSREVMMNRTALQQVLVNLIVNAIHAMSHGGKLEIRSYDSDYAGEPGVAIDVVDNGPGIPDDVTKRIFDPFFTTKSREGTGLGLSISQMLASREGGRISVHSIMGEGTTFTVWLPEAQGSVSDQV